MIPANFDLNFGGIFRDLRIAYAIGFMEVLLAFLIFCDFKPRECMSLLAGILLLHVLFYDTRLTYWKSRYGIDRWL